MTPQTKGLVPEPEAERIRNALALRDEAQLQLELAVADALKAGGSVREVVNVSGLSNTTVQKYGRKHGWPTTGQRAEWERRQEAHDEWKARLEAAAAIVALMDEGVTGDNLPESQQA